MTDHSLNGKTVLITGGGKNLGGLIARDLAANGAGAIAIHYNSPSSKDAADETVAAVQTAGAKAVAFQGDLTTGDAVSKLFADTVAAVGRPDIAINTVGKVIKKPFTEITEEEYDSASAVNAKSAFLFLKEAGKHVNDNGKIVTLVTSLLGAYTPFYAAYAGTKARSNTSPVPRRRNTGNVAFRSRRWAPAPWTRRSSTPPRARTRWRTTRRPRHSRRSPRPD
ncbi:short chain dehydrogenase family protein [Mycobacteroides abscessus subsp. bolletii 1513]|uniref:Short chain dehydrogenase family protein n=1 Tax=Mycobacteroides abscessus subsp. bolletii 1513 TaxID=1299321 RepID=X8DK53_9MYCO|nr:short chain dehydrogenase family protein [Mycobacteroides abscessus subsp. bolletii 1513]